MAAGGGDRDAAFIAGTDRPRRPRRARDGLVRHPRWRRSCAAETLGNGMHLSLPTCPPWRLPTRVGWTHCWVSTSPPDPAETFRPHRAGNRGRATLYQRRGARPGSTGSRQRWPPCGHLHDAGKPRSHTMARVEPGTCHPKRKPAIVAISPALWVQGRAVVRRLARERVRAACSCHGFHEISN